MKKAKSKLTTLLVALCCVFAMLGVVTVVNSQKTTVKATTNTATIYQLTALDASNATHIEASPSIESQKPTIGVDNWEAKYTFVADSGEGFLFNGSPLAPDAYSIKKPNDFYIELLSNTAVNGDVVTLDGAFANADLDLSIDFDNISLTFDGTAWTTNVKTIELPELKVVWPSTATGSASCIYLGTGDGSTLPIKSWDYAFSYSAGEGFTVDGTASTVELKLPGEETRAIYIAFSEVSVGQEVALSGTYYSEQLRTKLVIPEFSATWDGSVWEQEIKYTTHELGKLTFHGNSTVGGAKNDNASLYFISEDENITIPNCTWTPAFSILEGGLKVNGELVDLLDMKSPDGFIYIKFNAVAEGSVVSISGTFRCADYAVEYVIEESKFVWNGNTWEPYVEYTTYEVGTLVYANGYDSDATFIDFRREDEEIFEVGSWDYAYTLVDGSGAGFTLNDEPLAVEEVKFPGSSMFVNFVAVPSENDVLVIEGTWYCAATATKYVVERSTLVWVDGKFMTALEIAVQNAKDDLDDYFAENYAQTDYYEADWNNLLAIVEEGKNDIEECADSDAIAEVVTGVKEDLAEVLTILENEAIIGEARTNAKNELDAYKNQVDYKDAEWATIQSIIADAKTTIDNCSAVADIAGIVSDAKDAIDEVKTAEQVDAEALATAKENAKSEVRAYYNALDFDSYSEEAIATLNTYLTTANSAIENATAVADVEKAVSDFKASVDAVEKISANGGDNGGESGGCAGSVSGVALFPMLALAFGMIIRKKR